MTSGVWKKTNKQNTNAALLVKENGSEREYCPAEWATTTATCK